MSHFFSSAIKKLSCSLFPRLIVLHGTSLWSFFDSDQNITVDQAALCSSFYIYGGGGGRLPLSLRPVSSLGFESTFYFLRLDRRGNKYLCIIQTINFPNTAPYDKLSSHSHGSYVILYHVVTQELMMSAFHTKQISKNFHMTLQGTRQPAIGWSSILQCCQQNVGILSNPHVEEYKTYLIVLRGVAFQKRPNHEGSILMSGISVLTK